MVSQIDLHIARQIKKMRKEKKLTPTELSMLLNFKSHVSILRMEQGKQSFSATSLYMLCCIFNITPNSLFPKIRNAKIVKQERQVFIKPKVFKVSGLPTVK